MSNPSVAFVTGTSTGFGYLTAQALAAEGFRVYATMRDPSGRNAEPNRSLSALGITVLDMDVTSEASVDAAAHRVLSDVSAVDLLINNAGTAHMGVTEAFTPQSVERQFATNVIGPHRVSRAFLPGMRARRNGLIIFVSSVLGRMVFPFTGVYAASKYALEALAESLSYELRPFDVDVALVEPGAYATNIINVMIAPDDSARVGAYGETAKLFESIGSELGSNAGDPSEVSAAIVRLAKQAPGSRALRTTVPADHSVASINTAIEPVQRGAMEAFGLQALFPEAVAPV